MQRFVQFEIQLEVFFLWESTYGCPTCVDGDYTLSEGPCEEGVQSIVYIKNAHCNGPQYMGKANVDCQSTFFTFQLENSTILTELYLPVLQLDVSFIASSLSQDIYDYFKLKIVISLYFPV